MTLQDFGLDAFVAERACVGMKVVDLANLLCGIPGMLIDRGYLAVLPCRRIHLECMGDIDIRVEEHES